MKKITKQATVTLRNLSHEGRGVGEVDGKTVFVSGGLANETVRFAYRKRRANFDEGEVTEVLIPSPQRVSARCQHFGTCGGCSLQHLDPNRQIQHKQNSLAELLAHQGSTPQRWLTPIRADIWGYRNKARLGVKYVAGKQKVLVGFREKQSRFLANLNECEVLHPSIGKKLQAISDALYSLKARDKIAQIEVAVDDRQTALILRHLVELNTTDLEKIKALGIQQGFKIYLQAKGIDSIQLFYPSDGDELMEYTLNRHKLRLQFHPSQFTQVNPNINQQLIDKAIELLALNQNDSVADLFCGIGNFTLPLARRARYVVGVEGSEQAIQQARANATLNGITNTEFYCANLFESPFSQWSQQRFDKLLLDPPRSGAAEVMDWLDVWQPQKIVYISCNPATLARDSRAILNKGYTFNCAGVADMFPHTQHVESIALFSQ